MLRARLADLALAIGFTVGGQVELRVHTSDGYAAGGTALNTALFLLVDAALVGWRVAPGWTLLAMSSVLTLTSLVTDHSAFFWTTILPLALVVFSAARRLPAPWGRWAWLPATVAIYSDAVHDPGVRGVSNLVSALVVLGGVSVGARLLRRYEEQRDRLAATLSELGAEQARRERLAAQTERNRIASELHDVVAHAVSEMVLQVGAARMGLQAAHHAVPRQLEAAESTGREALADLRRSLGLLPDHPDHGLAPLPDLAAVDRLVAGFADVGLDVRLHRPPPELGWLPAGLQLAVHRVLQESLTNALKHAGPGRVDVTLHQVGSEVVLDVVNGTPTAAVAGSAVLPSGRHGLAGMRERVAVHGGRLEAGATLDGGFRVRASWPLSAIREPSR